MDSTKRAIKFQNYDLKKAMGGFWAIIIAVNIFAYILTLYSNGNTTIGPFIRNDNYISMTGSNIMSILIFFIIYGLIMYHEYFPLALSFGVTRKNFYKSAIVDNIIAAFSFAVIQTVLQILDKYLVESLGYKALVGFGLFNTSTDNMFFIIITLFTLFLTIAAVTSLLGILQYKYGYKFWIGFVIVIIFSSSMARFFISENSYFYNRALDLFKNTSRLSVFILEFVTITICYILNYLFIKKASIKN